MAEREGGWGVVEGGREGGRAGGTGKGRRWEGQKGWDSLIHRAQCTFFYAMNPLYSNVIII